MADKPFPWLSFPRFTCPMYIWPIYSSKAYPWSHIVRADGTYINDDADVNISLDRDIVFNLNAIEHRTPCMTMQKVNLNELSSNSITYKMQSNVNATTLKLTTTSLDIEKA